MTDFGKIKCPSGNLTLKGDSKAAKLDLVFTVVGKSGLPVEVSPKAAQELIDTLQKFIRAANVPKP